MDKHMHIPDKGEKRKDDNYYSIVNVEKCQKGSVLCFSKVDT